MDMDRDGIRFSNTEIPVPFRSLKGSFADSTFVWVYIYIYLFHKVVGEAAAPFLLRSKGKERKAKQGNGLTIEDSRYNCTGITPTQLLKPPNHPATNAALKKDPPWKVS